MLFIHDVAYVKCQIGAFGNLVFERCIKLPVNGRKVQLSENVFYRFREGRIIEVWSVIDKAAVEAQL